jgi:glucosamine--fructose-6-phosphate aminotransferase (isomerizing)
MQFFHRFCKKVKMSVWDDITSQAENLQRVVKAHDRPLDPNLEWAAGLLRKASRIIFTGVGSGLNATIPACYYLMGGGHPAQYLDATEAVYGMLPGFKGATLVLNTRSGETAELIKLARLAWEETIPTIAVTNEIQSTVGQLAEVAVQTHSRWDDLVVVCAYGGMLATELVLAAEVCGRLDDMLDGLHKAGDTIGDAFSQAINLRQKILELFREARPVYLLGRGPSIASGLGGQLVLEEMSRRPAVAIATGMFRQGPLEVVDENFRAIMFEGSGEHARLNASLARELLANRARILWVGSSKLAGALNITLPDLPAHILPLLEIVPCHILAYDLAVSSGIEPGTVRYLQKVITSEEGIPNLPQSPEKGGDGEEKAALRN